MPNHVTNILTVNGSQDELIIDSLFNEENEIDFNTYTLPKSDYIKKYHQNEVGKVYDEAEKEKKDAV
jgi:hypothetical protein